MGWFYGGFRPYVPVAKRRAQAEREVAKRVKKGEKVHPVKIDGRTIASTFWGKAWCTNLECYSDFSNRLPRGRTYVRNGSVVDLKIKKGQIKALVSGSELYTVTIDISALPEEQWESLKQRCAGQIGSLVELLQGKLSKGVMEQVTNRDQGLFPKPKEIKMRCSCPDVAGMCKHVAAVMYGVGHRLDSSPDMLFELRAVDHMELIEQAVPAAPRETGGQTPQIDAGDLGAIFDIEIAESAPTATEAVESASASKKRPSKKVATRTDSGKKKPAPSPKRTRTKPPAKKG